MPNADLVADLERFIVMTVRYETEAWSLHNSTQLALARDNLVETLSLMKPPPTNGTGAGDD